MLERHGVKGFFSGLGVLFLLAANVFAEGGGMTANAEGAIRIDVGRQLFVDDYLIGDMAGGAQQ